MRPGGVLDQRCHQDSHADQEERECPWIGSYVDENRSHVSLLGPGPFAVCECDAQCA